MATVVGPGDRLLTTSGRRSWLKRPSVPLSFYGGGAVTLSGDAYTISYQSIYECQPWVGVMVNKLNRQVARLPLKTYRLKDDGERERVRNHELPQLLSRPFSRASAATFKQKATFPALVQGNALLHKFRDAPGAPPHSLVPLDWRYLTPHSDEGGGLLFWETTQTGQPRFIDPSDVLHFAFEGGTGDLGVSPLKQLGITVRTEDSAQRYQSSSFDNGARPSGALVAPPDVKWDEPEKEELRAAVAGTQGGVDNAFKMALLSGGLTWVPFSHTAVEAELIEQRKLNREEVAAVYDIPPPLVGILDHATYSNVAEMHRMLYGMVLGPWLNLIEETIQAQLIDPEPRWEGLFVEFDLAEVLKGDTLKEVQAIREAIATGIMTPNEGRQIRNLSRSDNPAADELFMPTNNLTPLGTTEDEEEVPGIVRSHLSRTSDRIARKLAAGQAPWDRERFERELKDDLDGKLNGQADALVTTWADALETGLSEAGGDAQRFREYAQALGA